MARRTLSSGRVSRRGNSGVRGVRGLSYGDANFLLNENSTNYRGTVKRLSGAGVMNPGYRIVGSQPNANSGSLVVPKVYKVVSPLTGQGPIDPRATGRYANMNLNVVQVQRRRVPKTVAPNTGSNVVRPKQTALRRLDTRGQGTVSEF